MSLWPQLSQANPGCNVSSLAEQCSVKMHQLWFHPHPGIHQLGLLLHALVKPGYIRHSLCAVLTEDASAVNAEFSGGHPDPGIKSFPSFSLFIRNLHHLTDARGTRHPGIKVARLPF